MFISNRIADLQPEIAEWRRDFHQHPEICYEEVRTSKVVAERLEGFGVNEVHKGMGKTGVVAVIKGKDTSSGRMIGLRADMDALPISEINEFEHKSTIPNRMHACGHDGHTSMLLGAAKYLAETRNFNGTAVLIFQPAEEGGAGARKMMEDGLFKKFNVDAVYGMHNMPGIPVGKFAMRVGGIMAAADFFDIEIEGQGGHAAMPHNTRDPIMVGSQIFNAIQTIISREVDPIESGVISVTQFHAGDAYNVIPQTAKLCGTMRSLNENVRELMAKRMGEVTESVGNAFGCKARFLYRPNYPVTVNHQAEVEFAARVAAEISGEENVDSNTAPLMGAEDFSFMLQEKPGAYVFVGNGDSAGLHHPAYDFNDEAIPVGVSYWAKLIEMAMPA
jgi:amidohydrolase